MNAEGGTKPTSSKAECPRGPTCRRRQRRCRYRWRVHLWDGASLTDIARELNAIVRGWINYYGRFHPTRLVHSLQGIDAYLVRWAMQKYKRLRGSRKRAQRLLADVFARARPLTRE
jgi:Group II intron, maturase-specific domain